ITGIPLPFVSYGGSALIADFIAIGLLLNIRARRFA
ncbi:MAG TPA: FtsW/RodA/SpoVE family cell cycle protein, partial [Actinomycetota bacterium]|nr:FtsW/RodA/SpoVE family cell cycle protein [Actinomycetota bacterium]